MNAHSPVAGPKEHTPEWLDLHENYDPERERPVVFGASEAADVCNQGYKTALDVYMEKMGLKPREETPEVLAERWRLGKLWEPTILAEYEHQTKRAMVFPKQMFFHPEHSFMGASPDGLASTELNFDVLTAERGVESKASNERMRTKDPDDDKKYGEEGTDMVPLSVLFQVQQQMAVLGLQRVDVCVWFHLFKMGIYTVERNDTIIEAIVEGERELADRIIAGDPPPPQWTHPNTKRLLSELYGYRAGEGVTLTVDHQEMALGKARAKAEIKALETKVVEIDNRILEALEGAEFGDLPNGRRLKRIRGGGHTVKAKEYVCPEFEYLKEVKGPGK